MMNTPPRPKRIVFLYNHEALHQIVHTAPVIPALLQHYPDVAVSVLVSSEEQLAVLRDIVGDECLQRVVPTLLTMNPALNLLTRAFSRLAPVNRVLILRSN